MIVAPAGKHTEAVGAYVMDKTGVKLEQGMYAAFMVVNDNKDFVAGVIVNNFRGSDCEISCASDSAVAWRPHVCKAIFTYVFVQLGCVRVTSITTKGNKKARRFLESLGFQLEGNLRLGYDGRKDALIYGLLATECRYLEDLKGGQEIRTSGPGGTGPGSDSERPGGGEPRCSDYPGEPEPYKSGDTGGEPFVLH